MLTVQQVIDELLKIEDKTLPVFVNVGCEVSEPNNASSVEIIKTENNNYVYIS